jgi:hypothetical protein
MRLTRPKYVQNSEHRYMSAGSTNTHPFQRYADYGLRENSIPFRKCSDKLRVLSEYYVNSYGYESLVISENEYGALVEWY